MKQYIYRFIFILLVLCTPYQSQPMDAIQNMVRDVTIFFNSDTGLQIISLLLAFELLTYDEEYRSEE